MIVKVQISMGGPPRCLIYNKHRDWLYEGDMKPQDPLYKVMNGRKRAFFHAVPVKNGKSPYMMNSRNKPIQTYTINIGEESPEQEW